MIMTAVAIFLVGLVLGFLSFDSFLRYRISEMENLMWENNLYDPMLLDQATSKFWVPLKRLIEERKKTNFVFHPHDANGSPVE